MGEKFGYKYNRYIQNTSETRWATAEEIKNNSSFIDLQKPPYNASGIPLISNGNIAYVNNKDDHTLIYGATGSKKTRTYVLPTVNIMLYAGESVICTDPKGEIYSHTAKTAKKLGYKVIVLNFRDFKNGDGYNPLSLMYDLYHNNQKDEAITMMNDFISSISVEHKKSRADPYWYQTASAFAIANMLFLMEVGTKDNVNISNFTQLCLNENFEMLNDLSKKMSPSSIAGMNYRSIFMEPENTRRCTQSSLSSMVQPFISNRRLQNMLSQNTFDMSKIGKEKTIVYLIMADEKDTYHFLITTFIKQAYEILIREAQKMDNGALPVRVNYILDEFASIPRIPNFEISISSARSRNIRYFLIIQSLNQLECRYEKTGAEIIKGNCNDWIFLTSREMPLLREISDLCGYHTVKNGEQPLISVSELQRLKKGTKFSEALVLYGRNYPFLTEIADIGEYKIFNEESLAELPPKKFGHFKIIDFKKLYQDIQDEEIECPFENYENTSQDDEDENITYIHDGENVDEIINSIIYGTENKLNSIKQDLCIDYSKYNHDDWTELSNIQDELNYLMERFKTLTSQCNRIAKPNAEDDNNSNNDSSILDDDDWIYDDDWFFNDDDEDDGFLSLDEIKELFDDIFHEDEEDD